MFDDEFEHGENVERLPTTPLFEEREDVEGPTSNPMNVGMARISRLGDEFEGHKDGEDVEEKVWKISWR